MNTCSPDTINLRGGRYLNVFQSLRLRWNLHLCSGLNWVHFRADNRHECKASERAVGKGTSPHRLSSTMPLSLMLTNTYIYYVCTYGRMHPIPEMEHLHAVQMLIGVYTDI